VAYFTVQNQIFFMKKHLWLVVMVFALDINIWYLWRKTNGGFFLISPFIVPPVLLQTISALMLLELEDDDEKKAMIVIVITKLMMTKRKCGTSTERGYFVQETPTCTTRFVANLHYRMCLSSLHCTLNLTTEILFSLDTTNIQVKNKI